MDRSRRFRPLAIAMTILLFAGFALITVPPRVSAGTAVVFSEDFESGQIPSAWEVRDTNPLGGLDYWGISDYRVNGGNYSAWCAQVGTQSIGGQNNSDVHLYDDEMQADLVVNLSANGFVSLTLSFYYYSHTESGGGDWIQAWYEAGGTQFAIFNNTGGTGNRFVLASVSVPTNVERLILRFHSDSANHGFEGAYVDDIVLTGAEYTPPTSSVSSLPALTNAVPATIPYTAQDNANASGVAYAELWYRLGTSGNFTLYNTTANQNGQWITRSIPFDVTLAAGDGYYEFYTIAVDRADNHEAPPSTPDASMTIDSTAPSLTITSPSSGATTEGSATVTWDASDALSGIDRYEVSVDGGAFQSTGATPSAAFGDLAAGSHTVTVRAYDRAGNMQEVSVSFSFVPGSFPWWLIAVIVAAAVGLLLFFLWKRRKDEEEEEAQAVASGESEPVDQPQDTTDEPEAGPTESPEEEAPQEPPVSPL
ncbi:MAG TPA: Ig-like domain-containing protein [Thermoplasmata archaeon]